MSWLRGALAAIACAWAFGLAGTAAGAPGCPPTPADGFGPFGRGSPPVRASIGKGHALTGLILSSLSCTPIPGARVELWQSNAKGRYTRATSATVLADREGPLSLRRPVSGLVRRPSASYPPAGRGPVRLVLVPHRV